MLAFSMPDYHVHRWRVRREWWDEDGRLLRYRTCDGCTIEQHIRFIFAKMASTLFRQWDPLKPPMFDRRRPEVVRVTS
jgi:hypothetical protein